ncbi:hypothetical protein FBZ94_12031 [Bradyrhizobium sacchari]|uniref:Uncharacterized protein n=1 Tax=Bradyrhizobium sacchari TaxID=1399419 RepID=A0A560J4Q4_9BRAD|nr:hypothetical protein FBZ94_12031 [Bradyrhizobium sacchari]TWB66007.1 hypothetical protein FBZ95_1193 [Bradyrhizobium sacchari]
MSVHRSWSTSRGRLGISEQWLLEGKQTPFLVDPEEIIEAQKSNLIQSNGSIHGGETE